MKKILILLFLPAFLGAQNTITSKKLIAEEKLQITRDTGRYWSSISDTINSASTKKQGTSARAVYNYVNPLRITTGDVTGTLPTLTVDGLQGRTVLSTAPTTGQVLKWNGSAWGPGVDSTGGAGGAGIDTLASYTALRAYTGSAQAIYIQSFSSIFNTETNTTIGGVFRRVASGTENGGTLIVAANGIKWARAWDNIHALPEWWVVGGYDVDGTSSPTRFTTNGIYNNRDRATAAHRLVGKNGVVVYGAIVKRYYVDKAIIVFSGQKIVGNRTIFERSVSPNCVSTSSINGTTSFTVSDASQFRVGMTIVGLDTANTRGDGTHIDGRSYQETTRDAIITAISGNTITISSAFAQPSSYGGVGAIGTGQRIIRTNTIFQSGGDPGTGIGGDDVALGAGGEGQTYEAVWIYGNRHNGGHGDFPYNWTLNTWSILPGNGANFTTYRECFFRDTPSENIWGANGAVINCEGVNLGGSFIHYGEGNAATLADKPNPFSVIGCTIDSACMNTNIKSGHSEAIILVSNHTEWGDVSGNTFKNCKEGIFSFAPEEQTVNYNLDAKIRFSNNHAENCRFILANVNVGSTTQLYQQRSIIMEHNTFLQCGDFWMDFELLPQGLGAYSIQFNHNTVIGGRIFFRHCDNVQVTGNNIVFHTDFHRNKFNNRIDTRDYWSVYSNDYLTINTSAIVLKTCRNVKITSNIIEGFEVQNDSLISAINLAPEWFTIQEPRMKDASGNNTDFYYMQNIEISGNTIANFPYGICGYTRPGRVIGNGIGEGYIALGWKFENNTVFMSKNPIAAQHTWGIYAQSGTTVNNNRIYKQSTQSDDIPLIYQGLMQVAGFDTLSQRYAGWTISNNQILAGNTTDIAFRVGDPANNWYQANIIGTGNTIQGTVSSGAGFATSSAFGNNFIVNSTLLPKLTNPTKPVYNSFMLNKTQY